MHDGFPGHRAAAVWLTNWDLGALAFILLKSARGVVSSAVCCGGTPYYGSDHFAMSTDDRLTWHTAFWDTLGGRGFAFKGDSVMTLGRHCSNFYPSHHSHFGLSSDVGTAWSVGERRTEEPIVLCSNGNILTRYWEDGALVLLDDAIGCKVAFPAEVRRMIYTTNAIESLHSQVRKGIRGRGHFASDDAATKLIWLALRNV